MGPRALDNSQKAPSRPWPEVEYRGPSGASPPVFGPTRSAMAAIMITPMSGDAPGALLLFDGDCGFCTTVANWAQKGFRHGEKAEAWQFLGVQALDGLGLTVPTSNKQHGGSTSMAGWPTAIAPSGRALQAGGGWRRASGCCDTHASDELGGGRRVSTGGPLALPFTGRHTRLPSLRAALRHLDTKGVRPRPIPR